MAYHRLIATPVCVPALPVNCQPGADGYNSIGASLEFLGNIGKQVYNGNSRRNNGYVVPLCGDYGPAFNEQTGTQRITQEIQLVTGLNYYDLFIHFNLESAVPGPMNQTLKIEVGNGSNFHTLCYLSCNFGVPGATTVGSVAQSLHIYGQLPQGTIVPGFVIVGNTAHSQIVPGVIRISVTKTNGRGNVTGNPIDYNDGLLSCQLHLWRDCP